MARKVNVGVEFDGKAISHITYIGINQPINGHHSFSIRCALKEMKGSLKNALDSYIGKEVKIEISSAQTDDKTKGSFQGIITNISLVKQHGSFNEFEYEGFGHSILLDDGPHAQSFLEKSIKDIVKEVSGKYGVSLSNKPNHSDKIPYFVQYNESSFQFLYRLSNVYSEWFYYDGTKLFFGKPDKSKPVKLTYGQDLTSFDLGLNITPSKFKLLGYDYLGNKHPESPSSSVDVSGLDDFGKEIFRKSEKVFKNEPTFYLGKQIKVKSDLENFSKIRKSDISSNYVVVNGSCDNHRLKVGGLIKIMGKIVDDEGASEQVDYGEYRVVHLSQTINGIGNYQNHFRAVPASLSFPPPNKSISDVYAEIQPAEVLDNNDKEKLGRVEVQFWWQKPNDDKTPWIRVASSGAGAGHGAFFTPEKGDQVLVGFEHGNPNLPYVIGSLYQGKAKPEGVANPKNYKKVIKTISGNQIFFNDEGGKEEIKIENGSNIVHLTLDSGGKITISTEGDMSLSAKNISIDAKENIKINAGGNIDAEAGKNASLVAKSDNVNIEAGKKATVSVAQSNFTADTSSVTIAATTTNVGGDTTATTNVKGKMVNVDGGPGIVNVTGSMVKLN